MSKKNIPLVSIIIPVYNVEEYIEQCLESVIRQTYKNLEIIIVNDCSEDNSWAIIDKYVKLDPRIRVIQHEINKGLGEARNSGIAVASGKYLIFIDSDDYVTEDLVKHLTEIALQYDVNMVISNITMFDDTKQAIGRNLFDAKELTDIESMKVLNTAEKKQYLIKYSMHSAYAKLYDRQYINDNNIRFPALIAEDMHFGIQSFVFFDRIIYSNKSCYLYRINRASKQKSQLQVLNSKSPVDIIKGLRLSYNFLIKKDVYEAYYESFAYFVYLNGWCWRILSIDFFEDYYNDFKAFLIEIDSKLQIRYKFFNIVEKKIIDNILKMSACQFQMNINEELKNIYKEIAEHTKFRHTDVNSQYEGCGLKDMIKIKLRSKIYNHNWVKLPKPIKYLLYALKVLKLIAKKLLSTIIKPKNV